MIGTRRRERGAVAIEAALVTGLLILIVIGAFEYGMAFRSSLGLAASSREAARVGASIGEGDPTISDDADCRILESAAAALKSTTDDEVVRVKIIEHDPVTGMDLNENSYRPFIFAGGVDDPAFLRCTNWFLESYGWPENIRDNSGADRDWLAVEVTYEHAWITGFLWWNGIAQWDNRTTMRVEPVNYSG